jgi:membrane protein YqaA with SNARE-associated domain
VVVAEDTHRQLRPRQILAGTALAVVGVALVAAALGHYFREPLQRLSELFVDTLGRPGLVLGYAIPDAFTVPIPNDAFGWFGLEGGVPFWEVVIWGTMGSVIGGSVGYLIGAKLRRTRFVERFLRRRGRGLEQMVQRHGIVVVAVAAVTPLPYSLSAWAAGAARLPFSHFLLVSTLRVIRVAGGLYLVRFGLWTASG